AQRLMKSTGARGLTPPAPSPRWTWTWTATRQPRGGADLAAFCRGHVTRAGRHFRGRGGSQRAVCHPR
ncbi:unnamed protein product, partial [Pipistrellus nathusii]